MATASVLGIETWGLRKARRVGGRLDAAAGAVIDGGLDRLHEVVEARLGGHPVLAELVEEAEEAGEVSDLTRQQVELALAAAAGKDEVFGQAVTELAAGCERPKRQRDRWRRARGRQCSPGKRGRSRRTAGSRSVRQRRPARILLILR